MAQEATFLSIAAGDWLQAGSAFLGVAATILGTLFIEKKKREAVEREDPLRMLEATRRVAVAAAAIRSGLPQDATNFKDYSRSLEMQNALKSAIDLYHFMRSDAKIKNLNLWSALMRFDEVLHLHGRIIMSELNIISNEGNYTAVFNVNRAKVMAASVPIDEAARSVLAITL
jgi:hypothetical protein